jgi:hypothetical protein
VTCLTGGRRYYATLLSLLGNCGRMVPWIRSPLGIVALYGNQQCVVECWLPSNRGRVVQWIRSPLGIFALHGNQQCVAECWLPSNQQLEGQCFHCFWQC